MSPHDLHDYDGINEQILLDMQWHGQPRKVLVRPERNGYIYVLDRTTGEVLSAEPFGARQLDTGRRSEDRPAASSNPEKHAEARQGRARHLPDRVRSQGLAARRPSRRAPGSSTSRTTICAWTGKALEANYIAGTPYVGANVQMKPGPGGNRGEFTAWDVRQGPQGAGRSRRTFRSGAAPWRPPATSSSTERWRAGSRRSTPETGELLWQFKTGSGIIGQPITYRGPDGQQYVAILSGVGGWAGAIVSGDLDPRDGTAALGFVNAMTDLKDATTKGGTLYVFRLP